MGTAQLQPPESLVTQADALLKLLGGTTTTTNPGDTDALRSTLTRLQGTDYEAMLKAIFQQASGQIPGLQQALGNSIGARSGGNSVVSAALQKLLAQTSTGAMDQVAKLQAQNFATQANIGNAIAQTTQGTTKQQGTNVNQGLTEAAKLVALLQGAKTLGVTDWFKSLASTAQAATSATPAPVSGAPAMSTAPAAPNFLSSANLAAQSGQSVQPQIGQTYSQQPTTASYDFAPWQGSSEPVNFTPVPGDAYMPAYEPPPMVAGDAYMPAFDTSYSNNAVPNNYEQLWFADGGVVHGRGNSTAPMEPNDTPAAETTEDETEAKLNARFDKGFTANKFLDTFRELLGNNDLGKAEGYADGGTVRAGGSRRSANPSVTLEAPKQSSALMSTEDLQKLLVPQAQDLASPVATMANSTIANKVASSGLLQSVDTSSQSLNGTATSGGVSGKDVSTAIGKVGAISAISGLTGGSHIPNDVMQSLGLVGNLARSETPEQAAKALGMGALGIAAPQLAGPIGFAINPSQVNAVNLATSLNPLGALANVGLSLFGSSLGSLALGSAPSLEGNPMSGANVNNPTGGLFGFGGELGKTANDFTISSPVHTGTVETTDLGYLGGGSGGGDSMSGYGGAGTGYGSNPGSSSVDAGDRGEANGGSINGPGTGTSDSIPAKLSDGEFVMSADVVKALGEDFFNQLQAAFHTPVAQQRAHA